ncbi:MAG: hypothetical protein WCV99_16390 [Sterolibacterium sp.]
MVLVAVGYFALSSDPASDKSLPPSYSGKDIRISVVDAVTGKPIENAAVIARWIVMEPNGFKGAVWYYDLHLVEALTNQDGYATIPAWGPIPRPKGRQMVSGLDPKVIVFHPGYAPLFAGGTVGSSVANSTRPAEPFNATVRLKTYDAEIASGGTLGTPDIKQSPKFTSAKGMLDLLGGQLMTSVISADNKESAIAQEWQAIVMVDKELQRLSAPAHYRWSEPLVERKLAAQRINSNVPFKP